MSCGYIHRHVKGTGEKKAMARDWFIDIRPSSVGVAIIVFVLWLGGGHRRE